MNFPKKRCVAMLLAGGQGSRLLVLTENTAKPAVPFGGKYRIIDFPLSNCVNSGIDTVGILTQYQPLELNEYIGNGQPWGLNRSHGGVSVLPPYAKSKKSEWYKGTANAIYQNIPFIERYDPENVLILSGDHIYRMDYARMLRYHEEHDSDVTIAVRKVPMEEASRFGIMNTNPDGSIYEFEEKPKQPKSNNASMGIYIFKWSILRKFLVEDEENPDSDNDFGKNVIPAILNAGHKMMAYDFEGYWKDVGTISSLWEANMETLGLNPAFNLYGDGTAQIYARNYALPASYIDTKSKNVNCLIAEGCEVYGDITHSVISTGCKIGRNAMIEDSVIMPNVVIEDGVIIRNAIIGEDCKVCSGAVIGGSFREGEKRQISVVGKNHVIAANQVVKPGEVI
ncbi:MAG: glucose-1-phosphate adenylyltransferase [Oscillospiraceae bacterium]|nr:glucose-1-phosphate adenylyltransferase [Oscillospiraceae bacterium]MBQ2144879.1 glucose-1-phosphate adenylyltransferase [Oscillospiraceae bacterium]MBQ9373201.1 glucose-1-phosphate adenylyltransferase [Oscillospiraceae bacterium]MCR5552696.1 glucose-1-phosphate adenylyltransferase [Oscillospiraceae bacterium]